MSDCYPLECVCEGVCEGVCAYGPISGRVRPVIMWCAVEERGRGREKHQLCPCETRAYFQP